MKKRIVKGIVALFVGVVLCSACGSNSKAQNCAVCGKQLTEETGRVKATMANGQKVTVCNQCYVVGKQAGKCY